MPTPAETALNTQVNALLPYSRLRADTRTETSGKVQTLTDLVLSGHTLTQATSTARPNAAATSADFKGALTITMGAGLYLDSSLPASAWKFLVDGSAYEIIAVFRTKSTATMKIVDVIGAGPQGAFIGAANDTLTYEVDSDTGPTMIAGTVNASTVNTPVVFDAAGNAALDASVQGTISTWIAGFQATGNDYYGNGLSASNPPRTLRLGDGAFEFAELIIFKRILSNSERAQVNAYIAERYGLYAGASVASGAVTYPDPIVAASATTSTPVSSNGMKPFGVGVSLTDIVAKQAILAAAGVQNVRTGAAWFEIEGTQGTYTPGLLDAAVAVCAARGWQMSIIIGNSNNWATSAPGGDPIPQRYGHKETYDSNFGAYLQYLFNRYASYGSLITWEFWNEPDQTQGFLTGTGSWAVNHYPTETAINQRRLQFAHMIDILFAQPGAATARITTPAFADGGDWDPGFKQYLADQGKLDNFKVANMHCYGFPYYSRLTELPAGWDAIALQRGKNYEQWITEHSTHSSPLPSDQILKRYLIRSYATALGRTKVSKLFWFQSTYFAGDASFLDASNNPTATYYAYQTLTSKWSSPVSIVPWSLNSTSTGASATLADGTQVLIAWDDVATPTVASLGLTSVAAVYNQDGTSVSTSTTTLGPDPIFIRYGSPNLALNGTPIAFNAAPQGGSNYDLGVIKDGVVPAVGSSDPDTNYDSYSSTDVGARTQDWYGFTFTQDYLFTQVVFTEGMEFGDGGWFNDITVQVRKNGVWTNVSAFGSSPPYAGSNNSSFDTYTFTFAASAGDGIRIYGTPGGGSTFTSIAELKVYGTPVNLAQFGIPVAFNPNSDGGSNHDLNVIRDGVMPAVGSGDPNTNYDSYSNTDHGARTQDWYGYTFSSTYQFTKVVFQAGLKFSDGGWFNSLTVQVRQNGVWGPANVLTVTPTYPGSTGAAFATYTFTITPQNGDGIRVYGPPGGGSTFTSIAELQVFGTTNTASAPTATPSKLLGTNLESLVDYNSTSWAVIDCFKTSRPWVSGNSATNTYDDGRAISVDANGWPTSLLANQVVRTIVLSPNTGYPSGDYVIAWTGTGTLDISTGGTLKSGSAAAKRIVYTLNNASGQGTNITITSTNPADPIKNITVKPLALENSTAIWHPDFVASLSYYGCIRFMDMMQTNQTAQTSWSGRPKLTDARWSDYKKGAPVEAMVDLCNQVNADPWFCMPHTADDNYSLQFATTVKSLLKAPLKPYVEHSNEVWNGIFPQKTYADAQASTTANYSRFHPGGSSDLGYILWHSFRSTQVHAQWQSAYGGLGGFTRVFGGWAASPYWNDKALAFENNYTKFDALAIAPYFGNSFGVYDGGSAATVAGYTQTQLCDAIEANLESQSLTYIDQNLTTATARSVKLVCYEAGQHLVRVGSDGVHDSALDALFIAVQTNPRMQTIYTTYLNAWKTRGGGGVMNHFTHAGGWSQYGSWGARQNLAQPISTSTPKALALYNFAVANVGTGTSVTISITYPDPVVSATAITTGPTAASSVTISIVYPSPIVNALAITTAPVNPTPPSGGSGLTPTNDTLASFRLRTIAELLTAAKVVVRGAIAQIGTELGSDIDLMVNTAVRLFQGAQVAAAHVHDQLDPRKADADRRDSLIDQLGLSFAREATPARGLIAIPLDPDTVGGWVIPAGTEVAFAGSLFGDGQDRTYRTLQDIRTGGYIKPDLAPTIVATGHRKLVPTGVDGTLVYHDRTLLRVKTDSGTATEFAVVRTANASDHSLDLLRVLHGNILKDQAYPLPALNRIYQYVDGPVVEVECTTPGKIGNAPGVLRKMEEGDPLLAYTTYPAPVILLEASGGGDAQSEIDSDTARVVRLIEDTLAMPPAYGNAQHWREIALRCPDVDLDDAVVFENVRAPGTMDIVCIGRSGSVRSSAFPDCNLGFVFWGNNSRRIGDVQVERVQAWCNQHASYFDDILVRSVEWDWRGNSYYDLGLPGYREFLLAVGGVEVIVEPQDGYGPDCGKAVEYTPATRSSTELYADTILGTIDPALQPGQRVWVTVGPATADVLMPFATIVTEILSVDPAGYYVTVADLSAVGPGSDALDGASLRALRWGSAGPLTQPALDAVFAYYDQLGPGSYVEPPKGPALVQHLQGGVAPSLPGTTLTRWPPEGRRWSSSVRSSEIRAQLLQIEGVRNATVTPVGDDEGLLDFDPATFKTVACNGACVRYKG